MNFIQLSYQNDIYNILNSISNTSPPLAAWQNIEDPLGKTKRQIYKFSSVKIDHRNGLVELIPKDQSTIMRTNCPIFFMSNYRLSIFKSVIRLNSHKKVIIETPESLLLQNTRAEERTILRNQSLEFELNLNNKRSMMYEKKTIDHSSNGLSILISPEEARYFEINSILEIANHDVKYEIRSISSYFRHSKMAGLRVGLMKKPR